LAIAEDDTADLRLVRELADASLDGLVVFRDGAVEVVSRVAAEILGKTGMPLAESVAALQSALRPVTISGAAHRSSVEVTRTGAGPSLHLETTVSVLGDGRQAVWLRDIGDERAQHDQITAIATAALDVADTGSLATTVSTLAHEVRRAADLAAVQVVSMHDDGPSLRLIGRSGFGPSVDFSERLEQARRNGAELLLTVAATERRPVILRDRKAAIMQDPRWEPMHAFFDEVDWECFGAFPIIARGRVAAVLIAFFHPGVHPDERMIEFMSDLADQAALAVDYATLIAISQDEARRRERERIATEMHDSVVQQVFSTRLLARALIDVCRGEDPLDRERVQQTAADLVALSAHTLADLRDLIFELRPTDLAQHGFAEAIRVHANAIEARTGLVIDVEVQPEAVPRSANAQEDIYRIVSEALHNVVKHARAAAAAVRVSAVADDFVEVTITDDGRGLVDLPVEGAHVGLTSMRERARKCGGSLTVDDSPAGGVVVRAVMPRGAVPASPGVAGAVEGRTG
jgi:signal transduction histidine kinase